MSNYDKGRAAAATSIQKAFRRSITAGNLYGIGVSRYYTNMPGVALLVSKSENPFYQNPGGYGNFYHRDTDPKEYLETPGCFGTTFNIHPAWPSSGQKMNPSAPIVYPNGRLFNWMSFGIVPSPMMLFKFGGNKMSFAQESLDQFGDTTKPYESAIDTSLFDKLVKMSKKESYPTHLLSGCILGLL